MIAREQEGIMSLIDRITGGNAPYPAAAKSLHSEKGPFSEVLSSELRARSIDPATGKGMSPNPQITAEPVKMERPFNSAFVQQLINGPAAQPQAEKSSNASLAVITPGIVQLPVQASPAATKSEKEVKKGGSIDIASIVNFNTAGSKPTTGSDILKIIADNTSVAVGSRSQLPASDWEKYRMESGSKKGASFLAGGVMISFRLPLG